MLQQMKLFLCVIVMWQTSACQTRGEDCIYLLPKNYQGNVFIIFGQKSGKDTIYEDKKRLYNVDSSGVLYTKFDVNKGIHQSFFYWADDNNKRTSLRYILPSQISAYNNSKEVFIYNLVPAGGYNSVTKEEQHSELFTVSTTGNLDSIGNLSSDFMRKYLK